MLQYKGKCRDQKCGWVKRKGRIVTQMLNMQIKEFGEQKYLFAFNLVIDFVP